MCDSLEGIGQVEMIEDNSFFLTESNKTTRTQLKLQIYFIFLTESNKTTRTKLELHKIVGAESVISPNKEAGMGLTQR